MKNKVVELGIVGRIPFLKTNVTIDKSNHLDWHFLYYLGVVTQPDIRFYKEVLLQVKDRGGASITEMISIYDNMINIVKFSEQEELR
jgi:hypothetical protein